MTTGEKIKRIRTFRNMTQAELGSALGWGDKGANRIAQYETNYRVPKKDILIRMAEILDVNPLILYASDPMNASDFLVLLFWLDDFYPGLLHFAEFKRIADSRYNYEIDPAVYYHDSDEWPPVSPIGLWFDYSLINEFIKEWAIRKEELRCKEITESEYFEWKINWPSTCDDCGRIVPKKQWRK